MSSEGAWNVVMVAQRGRIGYQALLCAASIRAFHAADDIRVFICVPKLSVLWSEDPSLDDSDLVGAFDKYDCKLLSFENVDFGSKYPHSNKFYAILSLPPDEPFIFLDSDSIVPRSLRDRQFDFARPAFRIGGGTWPKSERDTRSIGDIWRSLYLYFDLDPAPYFDTRRSNEEHQCFPYYNASLLYYERAGIFGRTMLEMATRLWLDRPPALGRQPIVPWLDQIVLPLVLARLGVSPIHDRSQIGPAPIHYRLPGFLTLRSRPEFEIFDRLSSDQELISVLNHDPGFRYYLSKGGREIFEQTYCEVMQSGRAGNLYKAFQDLLRSRAPMLR